MEELPEMQPQVLEFYFFWGLYKYKNIYLMVFDIEVKIFLKNIQLLFFIFLN